VRILDAPEQGSEIIIEHGGRVTLRADQRVQVGQTIVLFGFRAPDGRWEYQITDSYRIDNLLGIAVFFVGLVLVISRWKGLGSLLGLAVSFIVIVEFIVPQILRGTDPLLTSIVGSFGIMVVTLYLAHGFSTRTSVALVSTLIAITAAGGLAVLFTDLAGLTGLGSEEAYDLQFTQSNINFKGLLPGGIIIGTLGVLDDVTTTQSATVFELAQANDRLGFAKLAASGLRVGSEHIASLVNTLVLAYAGVSLPLFLFFVLNPNNAPIWVILNGQLVAEEIVRTLAGSAGLTLVVRCLGQQ